MAMRDGLTKQSPSERSAKLGFMFESLGHVIHHLQDMAQPQHVRNDAHLPLPLPEAVTPKSRYEIWAREAGFPDGGEPVMLPKARDYWSGSGATIGIANYTNFNFVSYGSNFRMEGGAIVPTPKYPNPQPLPTDPNVDVKNVLSDLYGCPMATPDNPTPTSSDVRCSLDGQVLFVQTDVVDGLRPGVVLRNPRAAMYSIFTQDLKVAGSTLIQEDTCPIPPSTRVVRGPKLFTVNKFTFPSALNFLGPRAVEYSAGMLDYFVRGDIDLQLTLPGFQLEFKNQGTEPLTGTVTLYYDDKDGNRYPVQGGSWGVDQLAPNDVVLPDKFPEPLNPKPETPGKYLMVFTGTMGEETPIEGGPGAIVAKVVNLPAIEFYWSNNMGCMACNVMPPDFPPFIGDNGWAELSFMVPSAWEPYLRANKDQIKVKIGGVEYPPVIPSPGWSCPSPGLDAPLFGMNMETNDGAAIVPSWQGILSAGGLVGWANPEYGTPTWVSQVGSWLSYRDIDGAPNTRPVCSNQLKVNFPSPGQKVGIEFLVGSATLFKLCMKEELSDFATTAGYTTVLSKVLGARVHPRAFKMRLDGQDNGGCAGNP